MQRILDCLCPRHRGATRAGLLEFLGWQPAEDGERLVVLLELIWGPLAPTRASAAAAAPSTVAARLKSRSAAITAARPSRLQLR